VLRSVRGTRNVVGFFLVHDWTDRPMHLLNAEWMLASPWALWIGMRARSGRL
jgi:hypothetical protein